MKSDVMTAEARAFAQQPRAEALRTHPSLDRAYAAQDRMNAEMSAFKPNTPDVAQQVGTMIRDSVALRLNNGLDLRPNDRMLADIRSQVAHRSLDAALKDRGMEQPRGLTITPDQRSLIVQEAEGRMADRGTSKLANERIEARLTANNLAALDYPKADNPFKDRELGKIYERAQQFEKFRESRAQQQQLDKPDRTAAAALDMDR